VSKLIDEVTGRLATDRVTTALLSEERRSGRLAALGGA
jgi:hypothetical protein